MTLDADERVERRALQAFLKSKRAPGSASYFCTWNTYKGNQIIRDYKCLMYRKDILMVGCPHENVQYDIRRRNMAGSWIDYLTLHHYPEQQKSARKIHGRINSMLQAIEREPEWYRHHWFLGYTLFCQGKVDRALHYLAKASSSGSPMFPVECLNSKMILAMIYAHKGNKAKAENILFSALELYEIFEQDFEVSFNTRLRPWFESALSNCRSSCLQKIKALYFTFYRI